MTKLRYPTLRPERIRDIQLRKAPTLGHSTPVDAADAVVCGTCHRPLRGDNRTINRLGLMVHRRCPKKSQAATTQTSEKR